jgi:hypothetical protein
MERGQILVVATVVAALGLFGLRVWSNTGDMDARLAARGASGVFDGDRIGASEQDMESGGPRAAGGWRSRGESGPTGSGGGARGSSSLGSGGTARTIGGAGSRRRSYLGQSGSHRSGSGASSAAFAGNPGENKLEPQMAAKNEARSQLLDFLGAQPPSGNEILGDNGPDAPKEEVALEVKSTEDTSLASKAEDIEAPDSGEDGIKFTNGSKMTFAQAGGASGEAGTISMEIQPDWAGGAQTDNSLVQIRDPSSFGNRLQLVKNGRFLRFILADNLGQEADISVDIRDWQPGEARKITATWGDGKTSLFIDGQLAGQNTYQGAFDIAPSTPLYLGSDYAGSDYSGANGVIRDFTLLTNSSNP